MPAKLPNEILLNILSLVGDYSTTDLKPLALLNRQWHRVVAPTLLSTIAVSSLGDLMELCAHLLSFGIPTDRTLRSNIGDHTRTIVINGTLWEDRRSDCPVGIDGLGIISPDDLLDGDPALPDTDMTPERIFRTIREAVPLIVALEGFEWYGRFAGDYYLAQHLQKTRKIRHLTYGIEKNVSTLSFVYWDNAFLFKNLKALTITFQDLSQLQIFFSIVQMLQSSEQLEELTLDCMFAEPCYGAWTLQEVLLNSSLHQDLFVWPNLKHLVLRFLVASLWQEADEVDFLTRFLVAHPNLETLVFYEAGFRGSPSETALPFSLAPYPDSLPRLKVLRGSLRLIAGVLESAAACSSVISVIDSSEEGLDGGEAKAPYVDRIIGALERAPSNQVQRLRLEVPQLNRAFYSKLAAIAPNIRFLEFLTAFRCRKSDLTGSGFTPVVDIPSSLRKFPHLETVGTDIVRDFMKYADGNPEESLIELAKQVPIIKAIHCEDGLLHNISRNPDGSPCGEDSMSYLDNSEYDWITFGMDWRHRRLSKRAEKELRDSEDPIWYSFLNFVKPECTP
ncbi:hypothetical protein BDV93DRAFT_520066 [Ceratobasidium sp. AG-I]|nr:hypothetical protein BDV93DRAFT_520066 [Ceratobasidium sp. AG-I]